MAKTRRCRGCLKTKRLADFLKRKAGAAGRGSLCKACHTENARRWRALNPNGVGPLALEKRKYAVQKGDAKRRGVRFLLTFAEWHKIWLSSGRIEQRGPRLGQYCMARFGDTGPYAVGNVRICTVTENHKELRHSRSKRNAMRGNKYALGLVHTVETRQKISTALRKYHAEFRA